MVQILKSAYQVTTDPIPVEPFSSSSNTLGNPSGNPFFLTLSRQYFYMKQNLSNISGMLSICLVMTCFSLPVLHKLAITTINMLQEINPELLEIGHAIDSNQNWKSEILQIIEKNCSNYNLPDGIQINQQEITEFVIQKKNDYYNIKKLLLQHFNSMDVENVVTPGIKVALLSTGSFNINTVESLGDFAGIYLNSVKVVNPV